MPRTKSQVIKQKPPADFEEVKRRFIRQNRELAKANSSQSLRIRSLELEVGRLLGENLDLRERCMGLENNLDNARMQSVNDAVRRVKETLRAKIEELSGLVDGIENVVADETAKTREKKVVEGQWRERQSLTEAMRESQMPTIVEDKMYPRRTLNAEELQSLRLSSHSNDSPDLGPPPVARFEYEVEPMKAFSPTITRTSPETAIVREAEEEDEGLHPSLSINLETRRKRKDGQPKLEIRRRSILPLSPEKNGAALATAPNTMLRTGAKRKLADRDVDKTARAAAKDDFTFSRRTASAKDDAASRESTMIVAPEESPLERAAASPLKPTRRVLGEKSANMSPRKVSSSTVARVKQPGKGDREDDTAKPPSSTKTPAIPRSNSRSSRRVSSLPVPLPSPPRDNVLSTIEIAPPTSLDPAFNPPAIDPPQPDPTPTPNLALFSPTPSEPSHFHLDDSRAGTPPPGDLSSLSMSNLSMMSITTDCGTRPSRRARAAVNYAEPSLNAKMRRPSKQMVDAISGLQDPRRVIVSGGRKGKVGKEREEREVVIKSEPLSDEGMGNVEQVEEVLVKREERDDAPAALSDLPAAEEVDSTADHGVSAASATIAALMSTTTGNSSTRSSSVAGGRNAKRASYLQRPQANSEAGDQSVPPLDTDGDLAAATKRLEDLELYEFKDYSPSSSFPASAAAAIPSSASTKKASSSSLKPDRSVPDADGVGLGIGTSAVEDRRKGHRRHTSAPSKTLAEVGARARSSAVGEDVVGSSAASVDKSESSERSGSRRRSMMV